MSPFPYNQGRNTFLMVEEKLSIANGGGRLIMQIITPPASVGVVAHLYLRHALCVSSGTGEAVMLLKENPTSTTGTTLTPVHANMDRRNNPPQPETKVYNNGGTVSGGTVIDQHVVYPNRPSLAPFFTRKGAEIILKPNAKYTLNVSNNTGATMNFFLTIGIREVRNFDY